MIKLEKTLFLITVPGDKHEDHIPEWVMPLYKIKSRVSILAYEKLLEALVSDASRDARNCLKSLYPKKCDRWTLWETDIGFIQDEDRSAYPPEVNEILDRYLMFEKVTDEEWNTVVEGEYLSIRSFFPLKLDKEGVGKIDYL